MRRLAALGVATIALLALTAGLTLAASAPTATTGDSSAITDTQATVAGTVNPQGQITSYAFQYGTTTAYGQQTSLTAAGSGTADVPVRADLAGLTPGTTYHFRVIATNATGTTVGADRTFTTTGTAPPPAPTPTATTGTAQVNGGSALLSGSVNPNGLATSYYFEFGTTANYGQQTAPQSAGAGTSAVSVSATLSGLAPDTTFHYRLVAVGPNSAFSIGGDRTFTSGGPASSRLGIFGHTAFADQHGVAGVFSACIGSSGCRGSMTLSRSGKTLGARGSYSLAANDGGFVHFALNSLGQSLLRHRGTMRVRVTVANLLVRGQTASKVITLIRYSTLGLRG
ncbi:MAG TPA: fibronectin type III domain-containing protein [Conexibacter sp.]|nr:fibronectin type III domain-containing protein [Conexibacter sp.]